MFSLLKDEFVVGWSNIKKADFVGYSHGYSKKQTCVGTTNGAGGRNVQIFVLAPDLTVLHVLPGFWHPEDLAQELRLGLALRRLWDDPQRSRAGKNDMFRRMQLAAVRQHSPETFARSSWQGFDERTERSRQRTEPRDTFMMESEFILAHARDHLSGNPPQAARTLRLKPINVLVHDRMAARPFLPFADFDTESFVDYGRMFYDLNQGRDGKGKKFAGQSRLMNKRARESAKEPKRTRG